MLVPTSRRAAMADEPGVVEVSGGPLREIAYAKLHGFMGSLAERTCQTRPGLIPIVREIGQSMSVPVHFWFIEISGWIHDPIPIIDFVGCVL